MHFQYKTTRQTAILQPEINKTSRKNILLVIIKLKKFYEKKFQLLYEREGVNQYAGCLPVAIQLPVMIALYQAISRTEALKNRIIFMV